MTARARPLGDFLACLLGPMIWAAHFFIVYGAETVACLTNSPTNAMQWTMIVTTVMALAAVTLTIMRHPRNVHAADDTTQGFLRILAVSLAVLSAAAIVATALSAFRLPMCVSPAG